MNPGRHTLWVFLSVTSVFLQAANAQLAPNAKAVAILKWNQAYEADKQRLIAAARIEKDRLLALYRSALSDLLVPGLPLLQSQPIRGEIQLASGPELGPPIANLPLSVINGPRSRMDKAWKKFVTESQRDLTVLRSAHLKLLSEEENSCVQLKNMQGAMEVQAAQKAVIQTGGSAFEKRDDSKFRSSILFCNFDNVSDGPLELKPSTDSSFKWAAMRFQAWSKAGVPGAAEVITSHGNSSLRVVNPNPKTAPTVNPVVSFLSSDLPIHKDHKSVRFGCRVKVLNFENGTDFNLLMENLCGNQADLGRPIIHDIHTVLASDLAKNKWETVISEWLPIVHNPINPATLYLQMTEKRSGKSYEIGKGGGGSMEIDDVFIEFSTRIPDE